MEATTMLASHLIPKQHPLLRSPDINDNALVQNPVEQVDHKCLAGSTAGHRNFRRGRATVYVRACSSVSAESRLRTLYTPWRTETVEKLRQFLDELRSPPPQND